MSAAAEYIEYIDLDNTTFNQHLHQALVEKHSSAVYKDKDGKELDLNYGQVVVDHKHALDKDRQVLVNEAKEMQASGNLTFNEKTLDKITVKLESGGKVSMVSNTHFPDIASILLREELEKRGISKDKLDNNFIVVGGYPSTGSEHAAATGKDEHIVTSCKHFEMPVSNKGTLTDDDPKNINMGWKHGMNTCWVDPKTHEHKPNILPIPYRENPFSKKTYEVTINPDKTITVPEDIPPQALVELNKILVNKATPGQIVSPPDLSGAGLEKMAKTEYRAQEAIPLQAFPTTSFTIPSRFAFLSPAPSATSTTPSPPTIGGTSAAPETNISPPPTPLSPAYTDSSIKPPSPEGGNKLLLRRKALMEAKAAAVGGSIASSVLANPSGPAAPVTGDVSQAKTAKIDLK